MKKLLIPILILAAVSAACTNEIVIDKDAESKTIQTVIESMYVSFAEADIESFKTFITDDFLAFDMAQIMHTDELITAISGMEEMGITEIKFSLEPVMSDIYEHSAHVCYKNTATGKINDQDLKMEFIESYFMTKTEDGWKIKFLHSTEVPPPATETATE